MSKDKVAPRDKSMSAVSGKQSSPDKKSASHKSSSSNRVMDMVKSLTNKSKR